MKKLLFLLLSGFAFGQNITNEELSAIDKKADSLNINYEPYTQPYIKAKNTIVDAMNLLLLDGKYEKSKVSELIKAVNKEQYLYEIPNNIYSEKRATEIKDAIIETTKLKVASEKVKLMAAYYQKKEDEEQRLEYERTMKFLRETNYSPTEFKKLSAEEKEKLISEFEKKK